MKLITELTESVEYLVEETTSPIGEKKKNLFIKGIFLQGDIINQNKRIYPSTVLENACRSYIRESVQNGRAFGELGHPSHPSINLERVSHVITELKRDGSNFIGKAKVLDGTPYGKIVYEMINNGAKLGVSSRGVGSVQKRDDGVIIVQEDYRLATAADIVASPSAPEAFIEGLMEGVDWIFHNGVWKQRSLEEEVKNIKKAGHRDLYDVKLRAFNRLMGEL